MTAMNYHKLPWTTMNCHELPWTTMNCRKLKWLPWTTINYHELPWITMNYHELRWTAMNYHELPWTSMNYHELPWAKMTDMNYHKLPWTTMNYHELRWTATNHHELPFIINSIVKLACPTRLNCNTVSPVTMLTLFVCSPRNYDQCARPVSCLCNTWSVTSALHVLFLVYLTYVNVQGIAIMDCLPNDIYFGAQLQLIRLEFRWRVSFRCLTSGCDVCLSVMMKNGTSTLSTKCL